MNAAVQTRGPSAVRLHADAVDMLPWEHLNGLDSALTRVVWRSAGSRAGILRMASGTRLPEHVHGNGEHHVYVLSGSCGVQGDELPTGSYVHLPAGEGLALRAVGPQECVVLYVFVAAGDGPPSGD